MLPTQADSHALRSTKLRRVWLPLLVVLCCGPLSGCGTFFNIAGGWGHADAGESRIYGGVQIDFSEGANALEHAPPLGLLLLFVDMPLSFVADTVLLPYYVAYGLRGGGGD